MFPAEIPWLVSMISLTVWFPGPCAPCFCAGHTTGTWHTQCHSNTPVAGRTAGNKGVRGTLPHLKSAPKSHQGHQWFVASGATWEPSCPCVTWACLQSGDFGLQLEHVWRELTAGALLSPVLRDQLAICLGACWLLWEAGTGS